MDILPFRDWKKLHNVRQGRTKEYLQAAEKLQAGKELDSADEAALTKADRITLSIEMRAFVSNHPDKTLPREMLKFIVYETFNANDLNNNHKEMMKIVGSYFRHHGGYDALIKILYDSEVDIPRNIIVDTFIAQNEMNPKEAKHFRDEVSDLIRDMSEYDEYDNEYDEDDEDN